MGTIASLQLPGEIPFSPLRQEAERIYKEVTDNFSAWDSSSALSHINQEAGHSSITVPQTFSPLLSRTLIVAKQSGGAFNPLVGPLIDCWGFHGRKDGEIKIPTDEQLEKIKPLIQFDQIQIKGQQIGLARKGMQLDLGGVAKGYAVDRVWVALTQRNVESALIDLGGNLRCIGESKKGRGGWNTAIRNPFRRRDLVASFLLHPGEAVATSGNYERFVEINHKRYAHIIDPRTGHPVEGTASVTVIAPTAEKADILSTTLFVLGQKDGMRFLEKYAKDCDAIWIPDTPQTPTLFCTKGINKRDFNSSWKTVILASST